MKSREILITIIIIVVAFLIIDWLYKPSFSMFGGSRAGWMYVRPKAAIMIVKYLKRCANDAYKVINGNKITEEQFNRMLPEQYQDNSYKVKNYMDNCYVLSYIMNICFNNKFGSFLDWDVIICRSEQKFKKLIGSKQYPVVGVLMRYNPARAEERKQFEL